MKSMNIEKTEFLFLVVNKRSFTRFFDTSFSRPVEKGIVVDQIIVKEEGQEFYLQPHKSL